MLPAWRGPQLRMQANVERSLDIGHRGREGRWNLLAQLATCACSICLATRDSSLHRPTRNGRRPNFFPVFGGMRDCGSCEKELQMLSTISEGGRCSMFRNWSNGLAALLLAVC